MRQFKYIAVILLFVASVAHAQSAIEEMSAQNPQAKVSMYPNPATDYLHVKLESVDVSKVQVAVHNIIGNEIPVEIDYLGANELRIRVKEFSVGYYLLALRDEDTNFKGTYKFLKK